MCVHAYIEQVHSSYYDSKLDCRTLKIKRTCIFCGKTESEVIHVKDPPERRLPYFGKHL